MKKIIYIAACFLVTIAMQAQNRTQPKPGPAPKINISKPVSFTLKNGLKVLVVENHKLPRVSYSLTLDNPPFAEGNKKGLSTLLSTMLGNGTQTHDKEKFNDEIDFLGASFSFYATGASANGLSRYSQRLLELMADGALNPLLTQEEFDKQRAKLIEALKVDEKSVSAIAARVEDILTYGKAHYNGEYITEETLNNISLNDLKLTYNTYFVPGNAYLVIVGDVDAKKIKKEVTNLFGDWKKAIAPQLSYSNPSDVQYSQINFIDVPNAVQSEVAVVNLSNLKMTDKDFFAVLMANQILGGGGEGRLFLNLREKNAWTYGSYSSVGSGKYITKYRATAAVRNSVTDSAVVEILNEMKRIKTELVSAEDLESAKAKYLGGFVMQIEKPSTIARYALNKETQNLPDDFYENYIKNIKAVTAEDIKAAANKYFLSDKARIVITGKASEVLPNLEAMSKKEKLPIFYFDKFGTPTEKPIFKKDIPAGVTVKTIIQKHIDNIGGQKALAKVKSLAIYASGEVQGTPLSMISKMNDKGFGSTEMLAMGMSMSKQVVTPTYAYAVQQGQRVDFTGDELKEMQAMAVIFSDLKHLQDETIVLEGIEMMNDKEAYVLSKKNAKYYYDVKTGYKIADVKNIERGGQKANVTITYDDYKDIKGIKFPYKRTMDIGMVLEFTTTDVQINEGVTDADFK